MTNPTTPAGWYPAQHANNEPRYWDGNAWLDSRPEPAPKFFAKPMSRRLGTILSGGALVVGIVLGAGASSTGTGSELANLESRIEVLEIEKMEAVSAVEQVEDEARLSVDQLAKVEAQLTEIESELQAVLGDVESRDAQLSERDARITELESQLAVQSAPAPAPAEPAPPAPVYYANCTVARNAGAAPVYAGQPGYGKHLDRDGDGIGCE